MNNETPCLVPDAFARACPSRLVLARVGEKWSLMALVALIDGPMRFGALHRKLEGVSQKMLSQTLRNLERDGLVIRTVYDVRPLRVDYTLTDCGRSLTPHVLALKRWAEENLHNIERCNLEFDQKEMA